MANPATLEPIQYGSLPENDISNPNLSIDFDSLQFPPIDTEFLTNDLTLPEGLMADLGFDDDFDFSFDDIYLPNENEGLGLGGVEGGGEEGSDVLSSTVTDLSPVSEGVQDQNSDDSDKVLNSLSPESGSCDRDFTGPVSSQDSGGCGSGVSGFLNSPSPDWGGGSESSFMPVSSNPDAGIVDQKIKLEEEGKECFSKRKKETEIENPNPRNIKLRKSVHSENTNMNMNPTSGFDDEDKKKARLMRNRESAQLSRQRKKHYVEELEDKVRSMHSTIAELNSKISFVMAENASLRQQLSGGAVCPPPPGMYPPPPMAHMPYPWMPCPSYPMRSQGSQVPLVPIPRLKPRESVSTTKAKKSENKKKSESKTKKVASVSFLGLLFFMFLFGVLVPSVRQNKEVGNIGLGPNISGSTGWPRGRVLTVNGSDHNVGVGLCSGNSGFRERDGKSLNCKRVGVGRDGAEVKQDGQKKNGFKTPDNASEPLVASLYVPRNDKLVKIDGNLIIHSVLASEKAMASRGKGTVSSATKGGETGLAIPGDLAPALVGGGRNVERHRNVYRSAAERRRALSSGSRDKDSSRTTPADRSLQKWFREGLAGPILSSGMCTEVFQFDVSDPAAIIPATSIANVTVENGTDTANLSKRNRRILNHLPIPIAGSAVNETGEQAGGPSQDGNFQGNNSSMVVSVLVDPRENGDSESVDGVIRPKSLSRIFVVVLLDSVKYVTYSCVLPLKGSGPHLVTT